MSNTEALIAKLSAMQGKYLGDGVHESVERSELIAALAEYGAPMKCPHCAEGMMTEHREMRCGTCDGAGVMRRHIRANAASAPPLQWEDGEGPAQPERLPYLPALDP